MKKVFKYIIQLYLKFLTKFTLWRHKPLIVAVAGTADKTFVKNQILKQMGKDAKDVRGNPRSFNTEIGLPLAVLYLPSGYSSVFKWVDILMSGTTISFFSRNFPKVLVLELGVDRKGDMKYLLSLVKPQIAVITKIEKSFFQKKITSDEVIKEFKLLAKSLPKKGTLILNGDDNQAMKLKEETKAKTIVYGTRNQCHAKISHIGEGTDGMNFKLKYGGRVSKEKTNYFGRNNIYYFVAAKLAAEEIRKLRTS
ncbi:MAG TPA: hypothetical protein GX706_00060 [Candidatus Moranbacteria bacterium]|nr:hypothetical protein [Candidatus Moranbacteria bacterium]